MKNYTFTRRSFLKKSAIGISALSVFPSIIPSRVLASETAPSNKINLALIGCGRRGRQVMGGFYSRNDCRVAGLCDPKSWEMADCKKKYTKDSPKLYNSYIDVINDPSIDALVIATIDHWHVPIGIAAARKGKHIYVEKPLGISFDKFDILRKAVNENNVVFQYGAMQRSSKSFRRAVELVQNGYLGNLKEVISVCPDFSPKNAQEIINKYSKSPKEIPNGFDYDMWTGPSKLEPYSAARTSRFSFHVYNYALGYVSGWGAHPVDIVQWALGMDKSGPVSVEGTGKILDVGMFDTSYAWDMEFRYPNKLKYRFLGRSVADSKDLGNIGKSQILFTGDEGWVAVNRGSIVCSEERLKNMKFKSTDRACYPTDVDHAQNFLDCIKTGAETISPCECAIRGDTVCMLADVATRSKQKVEWDPIKEQPKNKDHLKYMIRTDFRKQWDVV